MACSIYPLMRNKDLLWRDFACYRQWKCREGREREKKKKRKKSPPNNSNHLCAQGTRELCLNKLAIEKNWDNVQYIICWCGIRWPFARAGAPIDKKTGWIVSHLCTMANVKWPIKIPGMMQSKHPQQIRITIGFRAGATSSDWAIQLFFLNKLAGLIVRGVGKLIWFYRRLDPACWLCLCQFSYPEFSKQEENGGDL